MEFANTLFGKVIDLLFGAAKREIGYAWNCSENVEKLKHEAEKLKDMKDRVQQRIDEAKSKGDGLLAGVQNWTERADTEISTAGKFLDGEANAKKTVCINLGILHHYGKVALYKTRDLVQIQEDGNTYESCVSIPAPTPSIIDMYERKRVDKIGTQKLTFWKIMKALSDESIQLVGIYGLGGVGKTTLAKEVAAHVKNNNLFDEIVFVTVSQTVDAKTIQKEVEVAAKRIIKGHKVLIILDDIWEEIVLSLQELLVLAATSIAATIVLASTPFKVAANTFCRS